MISGKCAVIKTSTRQTYFLPIIGLVEPEDLKPGDLVGVNKDSYLVLEKLPAEYDSRVKAMEVDMRPTGKKKNTTRPNVVFVCEFKFQYVFCVFRLLLFKSWESTSWNSRQINSQLIKFSFFNQHCFLKHLHFVLESDYCKDVGPLWLQEMVLFPNF